jgi:hypothetical protein
VAALAISLLVCDQVLVDGHEYWSAIVPFMRLSVIHQIVASADERRISRGEILIKRAAQVRGIGHLAGVWSGFCSGRQ